MSRFCCNWVFTIFIEVPGEFVYFFNFVTWWIYGLKYQIILCIDKVKYDMQHTNVVEKPTRSESLINFYPIFFFNCDFSRLSSILLLLNRELFLEFNYEIINPI